MAAEKTGTRRVKMTVGELESVDVLRISLVDRGANRVPFRITKREGSSEGGIDVIDFGKNLFKRESKADDSPAEIAALVVADAAVERVNTVLKAAGLTVENDLEAEGFHVYLPADVKEFDSEAHQLVKFDDEIGVFVKGAEAILKTASMNFGENLGAQQFIPGLFMANDALARTIEKALDDADTHKEAVKSIKAATKAFGAFVDALAEKIPADVFKLEKAFEAVEIETKPEPKVEKTEKAEGDETKPEGAETPEGVEKGEGTDTGQSPDDGSEPKVEKSDTNQDGKDPILEAVKELTGMVKSLTGQVAEVKGTAEEARELARKADKTTAAVGGTAEDDGPPVLRFAGQGGVQKREGGSRPLMDTAYGRPDLDD